MNKKRFVVFICVMLIFFMLIVSIAYAYSDIRLISLRTKSFPTQQTEIEDFNFYINAIETNGQNWGYGYPTLMVKNSPEPCWTLDTKGLILFTTEYDSFNREFIDSILVHPDFCYPNVETSDITKIHLSEKSFYQQIEYNDKSYEWEDGLTLSLELTNTEKLELKQICFGNRKEYLSCLYSDTSWLIENGNYLLGENKHMYVWYIRFYFDNRTDVFSEHFVLCKDNQNIYYIVEKDNASYTNEIKLIILPDSIQEKIRLLFENVDFHTEFGLNVSDVGAGITTSVWE